MPCKEYIKAPRQGGNFRVIQQGDDPIAGYASGTPFEDFENTVVFGDHTLSLYKPKEPFFLATDGVKVVRGLENMDGDYLLALLGKYKPESEGYKRYFLILTDATCHYARTDQEQSRIGALFRTLDSLITLHQREGLARQRSKKSLSTALIS